MGKRLLRIPKSDISQKEKELKLATVNIISVAGSVIFGTITALSPEKITLKNRRNNLLTIAINDISEIIIDKPAA